MSGLDPVKDGVLLELRGTGNYRRPEAIRHLAAALSEIGPEQIQINVPGRPPTEPWIEPPGEENLSCAVEIPGAAAHVIPPAAAWLDRSHR